MRRRVRVVAAVLIAMFVLAVAAWFATPASSHALATDGTIIVEN